MSLVGNRKVIRCKREQFAKAAFSINFKFDFDSNKIDESESQNTKHDLQKCVRDNGITIVVNPEQ
jgi:hypothetical protein